MNIQMAGLTALVGAVIGFGTGYVAYKATGGLYDMVGWATRDLFGRPVDAMLWTAGGAFVAVALLYLRRQNSN